MSPNYPLFKALQIK